jgi:hypothetical protein
MGQGEQPVLLDIGEDAIARIRLNRPDASNGMNVELLQALHAAILRCHGDPAVRVVVLSGEGRHFCAGGDVRTFAARGEGLPDYLREATAWLQLATSALIQLQPPVIAQVHGFAAGGGGFIPRFGDGARVLSTVVTRDDWPPQRAVAGFDLPFRTPVANLWNVGDGVKEYANGGTTACAETAKLVADQIAARFPLAARPEGGIWSERGI